MVVRRRVRRIWYGSFEKCFGIFLTHPDDFPPHDKLVRGPIISQIDAMPSVDTFSFILTVRTNDWLVNGEHVTLLVRPRNGCAL